MISRIVIDARMYGLKHAGIGRYVTNLISAIRKISPNDLRFTLLVTQDALEIVNKEQGSFFELLTTSASHYSLKEQLSIPPALDRIRPDLVHFPHFNAPILYRGKFVVTIHDLIKHYFRGKETTTRSAIFYWPKYLGYRLQVSSAIRRAKLILVPSRFWQEKLASDFGVERKKIVVTYEAVDPNFLAISGVKPTGKLGGDFFKSPFLIYTGSVYPHKNLTVLLEALKKVKRINLAIVCSRSVFTERIDNLSCTLGLADRVKFLGFAEDRELISLYHRAVALVQPSLMEGFGLTGLEAMAAGCPVISSDASCLPEVYGSAALYFDPKNVNQLVEKVNLILNDASLRKNLIIKGREQVDKYSWEKTARETLAVYRRALRI